MKTPGDKNDPPQEAHLFCHRCGAIVTPGAGSFYVVRIEAFADPTPPMFSAEDMGVDAAAEIDRLLEQMRDMPERELMDQVHRRLTIHLCPACYRSWIENPAG